MYIAPNSDIKILSGVPLDNTYEHTISWEQAPSARAAQEAYFLSKVKFSFTKQYYQRVKRGWLKIQCNPDDLYNCNYLMFKNKSFGSKWFYAFILSIEYVNNETAQVNYEVDVMQTWLRGIGLDYKMMPCFVERQHTATDNLYENLVPEEIANAGGEYFIDEEQTFDMNDMRIVLYSSVENVGTHGNEWVAADGGIYDHVYSGAKMFLFEMTEAGKTQLNNFIKTLATEANPDDIVFIKQAPRKFFQSTPTVTGERPQEYTVTLNKPKSGQTLGGKGSNYVPRNMKLYTYPFNKIVINNMHGTTKEYKWEDFTKDSERGSFGIVGGYAWKTEALAFPKEYRGISYPYDDGVIFDAFPVCCWNGEAYKAWWAQNMGHIGMSYVNSLMQWIPGPLIHHGVTGSAGVSTNSGLRASINKSASVSSTADPVGGIVGILGTTINAIIDSKHVANSVHGNTDTSALLTALEALKYRFTRESYRKETLRRYDRFFTKYGYAIKDVTVPAYRNRERWTYVKTIGCNIESTLNNEDSDRICSIYDAGITFWVNPNEIGAYELSNNPL